MGFQVEGDPSIDYTRMKQRVNEELKQHFRPEFLNHVDDTIVFPQLSQAEILTIVDLFVERLDTRLAAQGMSVDLTDAAKELLSERGYDPVLGARPLRRTIQQEIEDQLSERILFDELRSGQRVYVDVEGTGIDAIFTFRGEEDSRVLERVGAVYGADDDGSGAIPEAGVANSSGPTGDGGGAEAEAQATAEVPPER